MVLEAFSNVLGGKEHKPNKFTVTMGKYVKQAREEAGLSQAALAKLVYRRRATISDIENGKVEIGAITLALLAAHLNKPIDYFFSKWITKGLNPDELSSKEKEIIMLYRKITNDDLREIAINQLKSIANHSTDED